MLRLRKLISILFLTLFLFPSLEVGMHQLLHCNDEICFDWSLKHLHQQAHNCGICDYNVPISGELPNTTIAISITTTFAIYRNYVSAFAPSVDALNQLYRGPPHC